MPARIVHDIDDDATRAVDVELVVVIAAAIVVFVVRDGAVVAFVLVGRVVLIVAAFELVRGELAERRIVVVVAACAKQQHAAVEQRSAEKGQGQLERIGVAQR